MKWLTCVDTVAGANGVHRLRGRATLGAEHEIWRVLMMLALSLDPAYGTQLWLVLLVFVGALLAFDLALVRWWKLDKIGWKRVDYVWLGFAALGLISSVEQLRQQSPSRAFAQLQASMEESLPTQPLLIAIAGCRDGGSIGPGKDGAACAWARRVAVELKPRPEESPSSMRDRLRLVARPPVASNPLVRALVALQEWYLAASLDVLDRIGAMKAQSRALESLLFRIGPLLMAVAVALRITKVTGEIKLDRIRGVPADIEGTVEHRVDQTVRPAAVSASHGEPEVLRKLPSAAKPLRRHRVMLACRQQRVTTPRMRAARA
jgi:hypothetical protein